MCNKPFAGFHSRSTRLAYWDAIVALGQDQQKACTILKPNIMLGHNVIYVDTICLCGLHGWSSDSHQSNLSFKSQSFLSPWGSVRVKEHAFPRSSPLTFTITAITSLRKKFFCQASPIIFYHLYNIYPCNQLSDFAPSVPFLFLFFFFSYILYSVF